MTVCVVFQKKWSLQIQETILKQRISWFFFLTTSYHSKSVRCVIRWCYPDNWPPKYYVTSFLSSSLRNSFIFFKHKWNMCHNELENYKTSYYRWIFNKNRAKIIETIFSVKLKWIRDDIFQITLNSVLLFHSLLSLQNKQPFFPGIFPSRSSIDTVAFFPETPMQLECIGIIIGS